MNKKYFTEKHILYLAGFIIVITALIMLAVLSYRKSARVKSETRSRVASTMAGPGVRVVNAGRSSGTRTISLTGEARSYATVTLYAKVSGYLKEIRVDKGDRVKAGQVLAVIESPELDRQYEAALFDAKNKRIDAERFKALVEKGYVSRQDADNSETAAKVAEANAESLRSQKDYEILRAPFSAIVTARFADPGALVQSATTSQTNALPLVTLSETGRLRVYVYLDQKDAALVRVGDQAEIFDAARPDVRLTAALSRVSGELDPKTRTLLAEFDVENRKGEILAGSFVQVALTLKTPQYTEIPAEAVVARGDAYIVGIVSPDDRVNFRQVVIADSDGKKVRLHSGLEEGERVVLNPGFGIAEGEKVQPINVGP